MGAQLVQAVNELVFTGPDDTLLITLYDGRILELFGDGEIQFRSLSDKSYIQKIQV